MEFYQSKPDTKVRDRRNCLALTTELRLKRILQTLLLCVILTTMSFYAAFLRPLLFRMKPERAHHLTVEACRIAGRIPLVPQLARACLEYSAPELNTQVAGLDFANPIGLAAGWDKSGRALRMLDHLGFGFAEVGSISARLSLGNPKPRLFRLPVDRAIVVNYGLPNDGAEVVAGRLESYRTQVPLGVNIVKTNDGPDAPTSSHDSILADYERSVELMWRYASYLTLNLSCPNANGGTDFFAVHGNVSRLLERLRSHHVTCPVFLKVPPNPDPAALERLLVEAEAFDFVRGFIFNLPMGKPPTLSLTTPPSIWNTMPGAVAGKPVEHLINTCIRALYARMPRDRYVIIGAGGVFNAEDAYQKIRLGASLVQIYSALIYEGPGVVKQINRDLSELLKRDGYQHVSQAVGTGISRRDS